MLLPSSVADGPDLFTEEHGDDLGGSAQPDPRPRQRRPMPDTAELAVGQAQMLARLYRGQPEHEAQIESYKIGRYAVLNLLGRGGMGTVYACFDDQLDRRVALKLVKNAGSAHSGKRMLREAQAMAKLSHPNVVPVCG